MINSSQKPKQVIFPGFPKLMHHTSINMICLMTGRNGKTSEGMIVWSGSDTNQFRKGLPIGTYAIGWDYNDFYDYDGEVTLHTV